MVVVLKKCFSFAAVSEKSVFFWFINFQLRVNLGFCCYLKTKFLKYQIPKGFVGNTRWCNIHSFFVLSSKKKWRNFNFIFGNFREIKGISFLALWFVAFFLSNHTKIFKIYHSITLIEIKPCSSYWNVCKIVLMDRII